MKSLTPSFYRLFPLLIALFILVTSNPLAQPPDPVKTRLNALSINTTIFPREINDPNTGEIITLTDRYAPLGDTITFNKISELSLLNMGLQSSPQTKFRLYEDLVKVGTGGNPVLIDTDPVSHHTLLANYERRFGTYGDVDGDGVDEILLLYQVLDGAIRKLHLQILQSSNGDPFISTLIPELYMESKPNSTLWTEIKTVALSMGNINFNNDSAFDDNRSELIVVVCCRTTYSQNNGMGVPLKREVGIRAYSILPTGTNPPTLTATPVKDFQRYLQTQVPSKWVYPELAVGSIDVDSGQEVTLVLNEHSQDPSNSVSDDGAASYVVIDDAFNKFLSIKSGFVQGNPLNGPTKSAIIADVAMDDVDADGYDEIILGGLTGFTSGCGVSAEHILVTIDDALNDFSNAPAKADIELVEPPPDCGNWVEAWRYRAAHVDTFDINGDKIPEVQVNGMVFSGWLGGKPWTRIKEYEISLNEFIDGDNPNFLDGNSAMSVGDYNGDGNEDLSFYTPLNNGQIRVVGIKPGLSGLQLLDSKDVESGLGDQFYPTLLMPNVDADTTILRYLDHELIFSEPLIVAVMAAAPCDPDWGQDVSKCITSFGLSTTNGDTVEKSVSLTAAVTVGVAFTDPLDFFGVQVSGTLGTYLNETSSTSYSRTYTKTFKTGSIEDAIVFTSIPIDRYKYALVSCNSEKISVEFCEPSEIDEYVFNIDLPRPPRTVKTTVSTYNAVVPPDKAVRIDSKILSHIPGDPTSYKTESQKTALVGPTGENNPNLCCQAPAASSTGQGGGSDESEITIGTEETTSNTYEVNYGFDFQATAGGVLTGFSVGFGQGKSLQINTGTATIYRGEVSDHNTSDWLNYSYDYGLFSYIYTAEVPGLTGDKSTQQFQVLDYWTVPPFTGWPPTPTPDPNATPTTGPEPTVQGPPPGSAELLVNNSVETDDNGNKQPDKWKGKNLGTGDKLKCNKPEKSKIFAHSGRCAFGFKGIGTKATLEQSIKQDALVTYTLLAGDVMRAAIYANGKSIPSNAAVFKIKVKYIDPTAGANGDGKDKLKLQLALATEGVYQLFEQSLPLATAPNDIKSQVQFKAPAGKLYIDDISISVPLDSGVPLLPLP